MASKPPSVRRKLVRAAIQQLESLEAAGLTHLPKVKPGRARAAATGPKVAIMDVTTPPSVVAKEKSAAAALPSARAKPAVAPAPAARPVPAASAPVGDQAAALAELQGRVARCKLCDELASTRTQTVFGEGSPQARLAFLGEAPGADEDRTGRPFVGRAGQLLTKIIEACGLRREEVYIFNTLKCRPPGNRTPLPSEAANCRQYLDRQLEIIRPEFICCLGAVAAQNLLMTDTAIGRLRGRVHEFQGIKVVCTYHPAYLLRNPDAKRYTWDDMQMLMAEMGIKIPGK